MEEWVFVSGDSSDGQNGMDFPVLHSTDHSDCILETPTISKQVGSLPWEPTRPQDKSFVWERIEAPLPPSRPWPECNLIHPRQLCPFPERLELPFSDDEILSACEDSVYSGTDHFTAWVKMSHHEISVQHVADIHKTTAEFREGSERNPAISSHEQCQQTFCYPFGCAEETQHVQLEPWTPTVKKDAFEKQIAGRWHIVTLQEALEYVEHELLTNRFHVTHCAGYAILFNKDTFYANVDVKSIYLHDTRRDLPDQLMEGEQGWVLQGVLSRASFLRATVSGQKYFAVLSLQISTIYAKKKGFTKKLNHILRVIMISQEVDLVAGDFNGTAWRYRSKDNLSTKHLRTVPCLRHRVALHCGDLDPFWTLGQTSSDFSNHWALTVFFWKCISMVHSPSHGKHSP